MTSKNSPYYQDELKWTAPQLNEVYQPDIEHSNCSCCTKLKDGEYWTKRRIVKIKTKRWKKSVVEKRQRKTTGDILEISLEKEYPLITTKTKKLTDDGLSIIPLKDKIAIIKYGYRPRGLEGGLNFGRK